MVNTGFCYYCKIFGVKSMRIWKGSLKILFFIILVSKQFLLIDIIDDS